MLEISPDQIFVRNSDIIEAKINEEIVMMCVEMDSYFSLDEIGSRVWNILNEPNSLKGICDIMILEYDIDHATAMIEVGVLLQDLVNHHLVRPHGAED